MARCNIDIHLFFSFIHIIRQLYISKSQFGCDCLVVDSDTEMLLILRTIVMAT